MERTGQNQDVVPAQTAAPGGQDPAAESQRPLDKHHPVRRVSGRAPGAVRRWERGAWGCGQGLPLVGPEPPGPAFQSGLACLAHSAQRTGCPASPGLPSTARLFQPPQARPRSGGGGPIAALGLVACFFVWGAPSACPSAPSRASSPMSPASFRTLTASESPWMSGTAFRRPVRSQEMKSE